MRQNQKLVKKLKAWWATCRYESADMRSEAAIDEDFYDGDQWSDEDKLALQERGQAPVVLNEVAPVVNWLIGTERRTRLENQVIPVTSDEKDTKTALAKSKLVKYLNSETYSYMENSAAFKDAVSSGVGWVETGIHTDPSKEDYFLKYVDWREIWFDQNSISPTLSDCRYIFRAKWVDLDIAQALYPSHKTAFERMVNSSEQETSGFSEPVAEDPETLRSPLASNADFMNNISGRKMVRIVEAWYREPGKHDVLRKAGHPYNGACCDLLGDEYVKGEVEDGASVTINAMMRMHYAIFAGDVLLDAGFSPYFHGRFPYVPCFAYRKKRDKTTYGIIRNTRSAQEDLNKRHSKSLHLLSTTRVIAAADAASPEGWRNIEDEISRPDGILRLDGRRDARFELDIGGAIAAQHMDIMNYDSNSISKVAGVPSDGFSNGQAVSSKAINARRNEGTTITAELFDNYRMFLQLEGEVQLSLIEQFYTEKSTIMLTTNSGITSYMDINVDDETNIADTKARFVISQRDFRETLRQSMFESLMEMLTRVDPSVAMNLLDVVIDMSDLPEKEVIVARIRELNGQTAPMNEADPNSKAQQAAKQQAAQQAQAATDAQQQAETAKTQADADLRKARLVTELAKAKNLNTRADVEKGKYTLDAAQQLRLKEG